MNYKITLQERHLLSGGIKKRSIYLKDMDDLVQLLRDSNISQSWQTAESIRLIDHVNIRFSFKEQTRVSAYIVCTIEKKGLSMDNDYVLYAYTPKKDRTEYLDSTFLNLLEKEFLKKNGKVA